MLKLASGTANRTQRRDAENSEKNIEKFSRFALLRGLCVSAYSAFKEVSNG